MDRPSTSQQSVDKVEVFEVREDVPYHPEVTRAPSRYDEESGKEFRNSWESAWLAICQLYNLLHHMQVAIVVYVLWHFALTRSLNGSITNLHLHMVFAGTGYQLFLVEAVLTLHRHNAWSSQLSHDGKRIVHGCLQLIGSMFVIAGTFLGLSQSNMQITTAHGICGVVALGFSIVSFLSGILALFSSKVRLMIKSGPVKIMHICIGLFAVSMGLITMILGFNMDYFKAENEELSIAVCVFTVMVLVYILVQPIIDLISTTRESL